MAAGVIVGALVINRVLIRFSTGRIFANGVAGSRGFGWGILQSQAVRFTTYGIKDFDSRPTVVPQDRAGECRVGKVCWCGLSAEDWGGTGGDGVCGGQSIGSV